MTRAQPEPTFLDSVQDYLPAKSAEHRICTVSVLIRCGEAQDESESSEGEITERISYRIRSKGAGV